MYIKFFLNVNKQTIRIQQPTVENEEDKYKQLDADDRRFMLQDGAPSGGNKIKSVFDLVSFEDRKRLQAIRSGNNKNDVAMQPSPAIKAVAREPSPAKEVVVGLFTDLFF